MSRIFTQLINRIKSSIGAASHSNEQLAQNEARLTAMADSLAQAARAVSEAARALSEQKSGGSSKAVGNAIPPRSSLTNNLHGGGTSHWYIALREDFDAIPLISYLAATHPKCVCFISPCKSTIPYEPIFSKVLNRDVWGAKKTSTASEVVNKLKAPGRHLLLLRGDLIEPPNLKNASVDAVVHWGLPRTGHFVSQFKSPKAEHTYLLLPEHEKSLVKDPMVTSNGIREHPDAAALNAPGSNSKIYSLRNRTKKVLSGVPPETLNEIYENQFHPRCIPGHSRIEAARLANRFAARVLLRGNPEDEGPTYKLKGPRLSVQRKTIRGYDLQSAVDQGLVKVHD